MSDRNRPLVSFIVPTLNRGRYVVRAVDSCLKADTRDADVDVEVIVLDSESDDGSWEALQARFESDDRVTLAQNGRGLGPTRSWLDGARLAKGDFLTFLWSDDYISRRFLSVLIPMLRDGSDLAIGTGLIRDLDDDTALPSYPGEAEISSVQYLDGYFRRGLGDEIFRPVSPACSLFSRAAFDEWMNVVETWCQSTPLRQELHWRRAIGPDLLLYLVAIRMTPSAIPVSKDPVTQFSHHEDSFSVSASRFSYEAGYWLARLWYLHFSLSDHSSYNAPVSNKNAGAGVCFGMILTLHALTRFSSKGFADAAAVAKETRALWYVTLNCGNAAWVALQTPLELFRLLGWLVRRLRHSWNIFELVQSNLRR